MKRLPSMLAVLQEQDFAKLWTSSTLSFLGQTALLVALPIHVFTITGSTLATGAMFMAATLPGLLFSSLFGALVDRWNRRLVMIVADLLRCLVILPLFWFTSADLLWLVYAIAFLQATFAQLFLPAKGAVLPKLVSADRLVAANALDATSGALSRFVGPAIGGTLVGLVGFQSVIVLNAIAFALSALLIAWIHPLRFRTTTPPAPHEARSAVQAMFREWREGLTFLRRDAIARGLLLISLPIAIGYSMVNVLMAPFVATIIVAGTAVGSDAPETTGGLELGWIVSSQGIGSVVGSLLIGQLAARIAPLWRIAGSLLIAGLGFLVMFAVGTLPVALVCSLVIGVAVTSWAVSTHALLQGTVDDALRGRTLGTFAMVSALAALTGQLIASVGGDTVGIFPALMLVPVCYLGGALLAYTALSRTENAVVCARPVPVKTSR